MIESAAYEIIKKEGFDEGIQQGMASEAREMLLEALAARFGTVPAEVERVVVEITSRQQLKELFRRVFGLESLEEFRTALETVVS